MDASGNRRRHAPIRRGADATEHGCVRNRHLVAPVNQPVLDRTDMRAVRAVGAEPFGELPRIAGPCGTLADERFDLADGHRELNHRAQPLQSRSAPSADSPAAVSLCRGDRRSFESGR